MAAVEAPVAVEKRRPRRIDRVGKGWEAAKDYWDILRPMRFCVFVWLGITLLITVVSQSQDALLALFENVFPGLPDADSPLHWLRDQLRDTSQLFDTLRGAGHLIAFAAGALLWAWQTFYWARFASRLPARPHRHQIYSSSDSPPILNYTRIEALNERIPRRLGGLVLVSVWAALVLANLENTTQRILYDLLFAGLSALVVFFFAFPRARIRYDLLFAGLSAPVAFFFAFPRWLIRLVMFAIWVGLVWWGVATDGTRLNLLYQIMASAMMVALYFVYWRIVEGRRKFANAIGRNFGLPAVPNFTRDLTKIVPSKLVKCVALTLTIATVAVFLASGFLRLPTGLASAGVIVWMLFALWGAGELAGVPRGTKAMLRINIILFGLLFLVSIDPDTPIIGWLSYLHSPAIIMSVAALWVFAGTFCLAVPGEILRLPLTSIVIVFAIFASFVGCNDNHAVRAMPDATPWKQLSLEKALDKWGNDVPKPTDGNEPIPLVLVATAGGASRAAFWTTRVLATIERDHPGFYKHIFAISSVSGGSLGAVVYRTMLNEVINDETSSETADDDAYYCERDGKATKKNMLDCGLRTIDHDFLGPTFLTGLYSDLMQRFLPGSLLPDRASALELSWEEAWRRTMPNSSKGIGLDVPFHSLWKPETWLPALIINGTSEKTGLRIITSNLLIDEKWFIDALGYFEDVKPQYDIRVSTAAHNSARFPYIDAAGTLTTAESGMTDRIVDGGYFENFGAGSLYDLLRALDKIKGPLEEKYNRKIKFFVIQITSDPTLETDRSARDDLWRKKSGLALNVASDLTAPPVALFDTGSALGYRATQILKRTVNPTGGTVGGKDGTNEHYAEFRLTNKDAAMNWVLSRKSVDAVYDEWCAPSNVAEYRSLQNFMRSVWNSSDTRVPETCATNEATPASGEAAR